MSFKDDCDDSRFARYLSDEQFDALERRGRELDAPAPAPRVPRPEDDPSKEERPCSS